MKLDEVEAIDWRGIGMTWRPIRHALDATIVGMGAFTAERAGDLVVEPHSDSEDGRGQQEVYIVISGEAEFVIDGQRLVVVPGTLIRVDPEAHREARSLRPRTTVLALGGQSTFQPSASEWIERARPHIRSDPDRAERVIAELGEQIPGSRGVDVGHALLAVGRGDEATAKLTVERLLREVPDIRGALEVDPDLRHLIGTQDRAEGRTA